MKNIVCAGRETKTKKVIEGEMHKFLDNKNVCKIAKITEIKIITHVDLMANACKFYDLFNE